MMRFHHRGFTAFAKVPRDQEYYEMNRGGLTGEGFIMSVHEYEYDIAISFAGEDRDVAEALANTMKKRGIRVFYDRFEKSALWGKNLFEYLATVYGKQARFCLIVISNHYPIKKWTKHELKWLQDRQLQQESDFLLPLRIDNTEIPGLPSSVAYLNWNEETVESVCDAIGEKLGIKKQSSERQMIQPYSPGIGLATSIKLVKINESSISEITGISGAIKSFEKVRSMNDGKGGCHIALNGGVRINRLWAYKYDIEDLIWKNEQRFYQPKSLSSSMSGRVSAWITASKVWFQGYDKASPSLLDAKFPEAPKLVAISESPSRLAIATKYRLYLFDPRENRLLAEAEVPNSYTGYPFNTMWFSEHGYLVTGKYASQVLWNAENLEKILDVDNFGITAHYITSANALDKSGRLFSCIGMGQHLIVINILRRVVLANSPLAGDGASVGRDLAFHPEHTGLLFCVNGSGEISLWNLANTSITVLAKGEDSWTTCFFPTTDILTTVDVRGRCFNWQVQIDL